MPTGTGAEDFINVHPTQPSAKTMTDPYLIAHKVRGAPAFDVAIQLPCPICAPDGYCGCHECDGLGFWWIVPTSGHRAYPYENWVLNDILEADGLGSIYPMPSMPDNWPDHYPDRGTEPKVDLATALGIKPKAPPKIERRL